MNGDEVSPWHDYKNLGGNSGVWAYRYGEDWIDVKFRDGMTYRYTADSLGTIYELYLMKGLADAGKGLNSHITRHVKKRYARKS